MGMHDGHRARLREQFLNGGLNSLSDIQLLEFLLMQTIPRCDVNPIAHRLLLHFGSLSAVFEADPVELQKIEGVGLNSAAFLTMIPQLLQRYDRDRSRDTRIITSVERAGYYLLPFFAGEGNECVYLMCLDGKCKLLDCRKVFEGSINLVHISIRKITEAALLHRATSIILAHNHPSGVALPSHEDLESTQLLAQTLKPLGIQLVDHLVFADGDFVSMRSGSNTALW